MSRSSDSIDKHREEKRKQRQQVEQDALLRREKQLEQDEERRRRRQVAQEEGSNRRKQLQRDGENKRRKRVEQKEGRRRRRDLEEKRPHDTSRDPRGSDPEERPPSSRR